MSTELEKLNRAKQLLAECKTVGEARQILNIAEAARHYAHVQRLGAESANYATEIKLRAERRIGELLKQADLDKGGRPEKPLPGAAGVNNNVKLNDWGINYHQSSRWQSVARIPEETFEQYIAKATINGKELTQTGLLQLAARQRVPEPAVTPPFPQTQYRCIVIDPPWPMKKIEREVHPNQGIELDYPTMTLEEIAALPIADLGDDTGCHLYLWVTQKFLPAGLELVAQWGYAYQCLLTWRKNSGFTPYSWMYDTEHVIFAHKGNLPLMQMGLRLSFDGPGRGHSVKPDEFYAGRVILASPEPRLDMFARKPRDGFEVWGNEI